jgi:hypothetical protein
MVFDRNGKATLVFLYLFKPQVIDFVEPMVYLEEKQLYFSKKHHFDL